MIVAIIILTVLSLLFLILLSNAKINKIAFRNLFRKKVQTILIILGATVGTALITGSIGLNDSMRFLIYSQIKMNYQEIDEIVVKTPEETGSKEQRPAQHYRDDNEAITLQDFTDTEIENLTRAAETSSRVDGYLAAYLTSWSVSANDSLVGGFLSNENVKILAFDFEDSFLLDDFNKAVETPVLIQKTFAEKIQANSNKFYIKRAGGGLASIFSERTEISDYSVMEKDNFPGLRDPVFDSDFNSTDNMIFMDIAFFYELFPEEKGRKNLMLVSNTGDWMTGRFFSASVKRDLEAALETTDKIRIMMVKKEAIDSADNANLGFVFLFLSGFAILSGLILILNTFEMLAKERQKELGTLRAIGFKRGEIVKLYLLEGFFYTFFSSVLGIFGGILITRFILDNIKGYAFNLSNKVLQSLGNLMGANEFIPRFRFYMSETSILICFIAGILLPMTMVYFFARRTAKMNIVQAISNTQDGYQGQDRRKRPLLRSVFFVFASILVVMGLLNASVTLSYLGISILIISLSLLFGRNDKKVFANVTLLGLLFLTLGFQIDVMNSPVASLVLLVEKSFVLLAGSLIFVTINLSFLKKLLSTRMFSKIISPKTVKLGLSYPSAEKRKTALIITMYALIVYIIILVTVIPFSMERGIQNNISSVFWGYNAFNPSFFNTESSQDMQNLASKEYVKDVSSIQAFNMKTRIENRNFSNTVFRVFLIPDNFEFYYKRGKWINDRDAISLQHALEKIKEDKSRIIYIGTNEEIVRENAKMKIQADDKRLETIGGYLVGLTFFQGIITTDEDLLEGREATEYDLIALSGDTKEKIEENRERLRNYSSEQNRIIILDQDIAEITSIAISGFVSILNGFLYFGMIVGIIGIAITMYRALYDRKRTIGMLKAIGFTRGVIFKAFILETSFIVVLGLLIGIISGIITSTQMNKILYQIGAPVGETLLVPWWSIAITALFFYTVSLAATLVPSYRASRLEPSESIRYFE